MTSLDFGAVFFFFFFFFAGGQGFCGSCRQKREEHLLVAHCDCVSALTLHSRGEARQGRTDPIERCVFMGPWHDRRTTWGMISPEPQSKPG